jgi:hypothetical protein
LTLITLGILECSECKNYICVYCADDLIRYIARDPGRDRCPQCNADSANYHFQDVDPDAPVRNYFDPSVIFSVAKEETPEGYEEKKLFVKDKEEDYELLDKNDQQQAVCNAQF